MLSITIKVRRHTKAQTKIYGKHSLVQTPGTGFAADLDASGSFTFPSAKTTIILTAVPALSCALYTGMERRSMLAYNAKIKAEGKTGAAACSSVRAGCYGYG